MRERFFEKIGFQKCTLGLWALAFVILGACRAGIEQVGDGGGTSNPGAPPGVVDDSAGFYVSLYDAADIKHYQRRVKMNAPSSFEYENGCKITDASSSSTLNDIRCVIDIPEEDISWTQTSSSEDLKHKLKLQFNVPSDMCSYVYFMPYYYQNFYYGAEPRTFIYYDLDGELGTAVDDPAAPTEITTFLPSANGLNADGTVTCPYDYTKSDGPNCCEGEYSVTKMTWVLADPDVVGDVAHWESETILGEYSGQHSNCFAGPAMDSAEIPKMRDGFPAGVNYYVEGSGINNVFEIPRKSNWNIKTIEAANFYPNVFTATEDHIDADPTLIPMALRNAQDSYLFLCLDRGAEIKARIKVYIQEWNEYSEFLKKASGDPNTTGEESGPGSGTPLNDFGDWDDYDVLGGAGGTAFYFPRLIF